MRNTGQNVLVRVYFPVRDDEAHSIGFPRSKAAGGRVGMEIEGLNELENRRRVSSPTPATPLITRETVPLETCAISAMSLIVTEALGND